MECPEQGELQRVIGRGEYLGGMSYLTRLLASTHIHPALIFRILPNAGDERTPDNSTQLNRELWTQVSDTSKSAS